MFDKLAQTRIGPKEVLTHIFARFGFEALIVAVHRAVHFVDEHAVIVGGKERIPFATPDHFDDVPARPTEDGFQFLDDLAVAAHWPVETLEVAVDYPGEIVEFLASRQGDGSKRFGLVNLAIADETPNP